MLNGIKIVNPRLYIGTNVSPSQMVGVVNICPKRGGEIYKEQGGHERTCKEGWEEGKLGITCFLLD